MRTSSRRPRDFFNADVHKREATFEALTVQRTDKTIRVSARGSIKTAVMGVFSINSIALSATSEVSWGQNRIELALVLDNTGSMAALNKMPSSRRRYATC